MKRFILALGISSVLSGCAGLLDKQDPICSGVAMVGGQETTVQIYGIRKVVEQTQYRAGYPFDWQWVASNNFKSNTCSK